MSTESPGRIKLECETCQGGRRKLREASTVIIALLEAGQVWDPTVAEGVRVEFPVDEIHSMTEEEFTALRVQHFNTRGSISHTVTRPPSDDDTANTGQPPSGARFPRN